MASFFMYFVSTNAVLIVKAPRFVFSYSILVNLVFRHLLQSAENPTTTIHALSQMTPERPKLQNTNSRNQLQFLAP